MHSFTPSKADLFHTHSPFSLPWVPGSSSRLAVQRRHLNLAVHYEGERVLVSSGAAAPWVPTRVGP